MIGIHITLVEMPGIEPGTFHMQSERSTTEPHPQLYLILKCMLICVLYINIFRFILIEQKSHQLHLTRFARSVKTGLSLM